MSAIPIKFNTVINQASTAIYTEDLIDQNQNPIVSGLIDALTLTLINVVDSAVVNGRNVQNVLNMNDVVVDAGGMLAFTLQPADTAIVSAASAIEWRCATFQMRFNTVFFATWDVEFAIRNLKIVP